MPFLGSMNHALGLQIDIVSTSANAVTIVGYGTSNKLLEASLLTFTGNGSSTRTVASTIKRYVIHFNGLSGGGSVNVTLTWNTTQMVVITAAQDAVAVFDVT